MVFFIEVKSSGIPLREPALPEVLGESFVAGGEGFAASRSSETGDFLWALSSSEPLDLLAVVTLSSFAYHKFSSQCRMLD